MGIKTKAVDAKCSLDKPAADQDVLGGRVCTNTALRLAARRLGQLYDEALAPLDLKATQLALIAEIDKLTVAAPQGPTLQDLATRLAIQLSALTHALRPLVRDGFVELRADAKDRRTKHGVLHAAWQGQVVRSGVALGRGKRPRGGRAGPCLGGEPPGPGRSGVFRRVPGGIQVGGLIGRPDPQGPATAERGSLRNERSVFDSRGLNCGPHNFCSEDR